jgi:uncharacterized protein with ParB-like and HNH nuclease domain
MPRKNNKNKVADNGVDTNIENGNKANDNIVNNEDKEHKENDEKIKQKVLNKQKQLMKTIIKTFLSNNGLVNIN